jgi:hypothetical protein
MGIGDLPEKTLAISKMPNAGVCRTSSKAYLTENFAMLGQKAAFLDRARVPAPHRRDTDFIQSEAPTLVSA